MAHPPVTKAVIPHKVDLWRAEVEGIRNLLDTIERKRKDHGTPWVQGTRRYYRQRLEDLLDNAPPSMVKAGEANQARE